MDFPLSAEDRRRFAEWLTLEAQADEGIVRQLEILGPAMKLVADHRRKEVEAMLLIARRLRNTEEQSLG